MVDKAPVSVAEVAEEYIHHVRRLRTIANRRAAALLGNSSIQSDGDVEELADITDVRQHGLAFSISSLNQMFKNVVAADKETVGNVGDLIGISEQINLICVRRRAANTQYADRRRRKLRAVASLHAHAKDDGLWDGHFLAHVRSRLRQSKVT